jgi:hypothetical protein
MTDFESVGSGSTPAGGAHTTSFIPLSRNGLRTCLFSGNSLGATSAWCSPPSRSSTAERPLDMREAARFNSRRDDCGWAVRRVAVLRDLLRFPDMRTVTIGLRWAIRSRPEEVLMPVLATERADEIIAGWRRSTEPTHGLGNPAGELYASGTFAEADIVQASSAQTLSTCSTGSDRCCC